MYMIIWSHPKAKTRPSLIGCYGYKEHTRPLYPSLTRTWGASSPCLRHSPSVLVPVLPYLYLWQWRPPQGPHSHHSPAESAHQKTKMIIKDDQKRILYARKCVGIPCLHVPSQLIGCGIPTHSQILRDLNQANDLRSWLSASILHHILQQHLDASRISGSSSKS